MTEVLYNPKIKPEHLARKAIVYLRQSSDKQVRQNKESQLLQYAVAERVRALGWKQVEIINNDLGASAGLASAQREGFERVLSSVALGEVGIVGSREVSRLSRTDRDWCRLLEVCQIFGTLIADEQQVYDLNYLDDQLVLGIKGTLSVVELKVIRQRLLAGQESKARRGELFKRLPIGYARDPVGKIAFHPDRRVCEALQLVFAKFRELWSVRQTFQWFCDHDVERRHQLQAASPQFCEQSPKPGSHQTPRWREMDSNFRFRAIRLRSEISLWPAFADVRRLQPQIIERRRHAAEAGDYRLSPPSHGTRNRKFESISLHRRVTCEPDLTAAAAGAGSISAQERHRQRSPHVDLAGPGFDFKNDLRLPGAADALGR